LMLGFKCNFREKRDFSGANSPVDARASAGLTTP
jgi:hypothetical protein